MLQGMSVVGDRFGAGKMFLPQVSKSNPCLFRAEGEVGGGGVGSYWGVYVIDYVFTFVPLFDFKIIVTF